MGNNVSFFFSRLKQKKETFLFVFYLYIFKYAALWQGVPPVLYSVFLSAQQDSGVSAPEATLDPGHSAQLHNAVLNESSLDLCLLNYMAQDWSSEYRFDLIFMNC